MSIVESMHQLKTDHEMHQDVRDELKWDATITHQRDINISVDHGVVTLDGVADSLAQKWAAERAVFRVQGVKGVENYLEVQPPKDDQRSDHEIQHAAARALEWDARVPRGVTVEVMDGVVHLRGNVERYADRAACEDAVRNLIGISGVENTIRITAGPMSDNLKRDIEAALRRRLDQGAGDINVVVKDDVVTLSGIVPTLSIREEVERTVSLAPGVGLINDQLQVS